MSIDPESNSRARADSVGGTSTTPRRRRQVAGPTGRRCRWLPRAPRWRGANGAAQVNRRSCWLVALQAALGGLEKGRPGVVQVAGEPGMGKTRLLHELRLRAGDRGFDVFSASASEFEQAEIRRSRVEGDRTSKLFGTAGFRVLAVDWHGGAVNLLVELERDDAPFPAVAPSRPG
ncbi:MAG: ATP-binding protein [Actinobacteria bacterium]|nr:ATP-binding protein [Actinomycetota bacterium]